MKRKIICILLMLLLLASCEKTGGGKSRDVMYSATGPYFDGQVVEISKNSLMVEPFDGQRVKNGADSIEVSVDNVSKFKTGDEVRVLYDGKIMEIYPAKASGVNGVYLLSEISLSVPRYEVCYANHTDSAAVYLGSLNKDKMYESKSLHLPIYKFDDRSALDGFRKNFDEDLTFDSGYDEILSFDEIAAGYDEKYFEDNSLLVCYVSSSSGSNRYGVKEIYNDGTYFRITVTQTNSPEVGTCDMAGWLVWLEVSKSDIQTVREFDCIM